MDAFSYLSVLISIILGLAVTQILKGFRGIVLSRARLLAGHRLGCTVAAHLLSTLVVNVRAAKPARLDFPAIRHGFAERSLYLHDRGAGLS